MAPPVFPVGVVRAAAHFVAALPAVLRLGLHGAALAGHVVVPSAAAAVVLHMDLAASGTGVVHGGAVVPAQEVKGLALGSDPKVSDPKGL